MKKHIKRCIALLLTAILLVPATQIPVSAESPAVLRVALISDPHYYPPELAGDYYDVLFENTQIGHPIEQTPGVLRSALAAIKERALRGEIDYLLITGDLTTDGEYLGHIRLAEILEAFEAETGVLVAVIPGNHDIGNGNTYVNGVKETAQPPTTIEDFCEIYKNLGYDLPNCERFVSDSEDRAGKCSYAADLGDNYRLVAIDTSVRRIEPELRAWVVEQCEAATAAGKTVVGMGHHNLNEQLKGQLVIMQNQGIENMREVSEEFADAGMHFYFSGHLHMSEISPWYSDRGEVLYDIIVPGLYSFPGDFRCVDFSSLNGRIEADIRSYAPDEVLPVTANGVTYAPYYPAALEYSFGYGGEGMIGFVKANAKQGLLGPLEDLKKNGGLTALVKEQVDLAPINALMAYLDDRLINQPEKILGLINNLIDDAFALPVSKLPCERFVEELGFGDPDKPGTVGDVATSAIVYMFWKKHDPKDDPFMQDVLRRLQNGELVDQVLNYALPKVLDVLGADVLPLLIDCVPVTSALAKALNSLGCPLLIAPLLALLPNTRDTISATFYGLASEIITSSSPTGSGVEGVIVYDGPVDAPTAPNTFRLPYDLNVTLSSDKKSAVITWYTKASLTSPGIGLRVWPGNAPQLEMTFSSELAEIKVNELDLAVTKVMGTTMRASKHTVVLTNLDPWRIYSFTVGDSEFGFWPENDSRLLYARATPVLDFFRQVWQWFSGVFRLLGIVWMNREYY